MSDQPPEDVLGNPIVKDVLVTIRQPFIVIWRVLAVDNGSATSPARIRLAADITLHASQGTPFLNVARVVTPPDQEMLERLTGIRRQ